MSANPWTGLPPDPTVSGWHWLRYRDAETPEVVEWSSLCERWFFSGVSGSDTAEQITARMVYVGPCDPNAAAEIERLRGWLSYIAGNFSHGPTNAEQALAGEPIPEGFSP